MSCLLFFMRALYSEIRNFFPSTMHVRFGRGLQKTGTINYNLHNNEWSLTFSIKHNTSPIINHNINTEILCSSAFEMCWGKEKWLSHLYVDLAVTGSMLKWVWKIVLGSDVDPAWFWVPEKALRSKGITRKHGSPSAVLSIQLWRWHHLS